MAPQDGEAGMRNMMKAGPAALALMASGTAARAQSDTCEGVVSVTRA